MDVSKIDDLLKATILECKKNEGFFFILKSGGVADFAIAMMRDDECRWPDDAQRLTLATELFVIAPICDEAEVQIRTTEEMLNAMDEVPPTTHLNVKTDNVEN